MRGPQQFLANRQRAALEVQTGLEASRRGRALTQGNQDLGDSKILIAQRGDPHFERVRQHCARRCVLACQSVPHRFDQVEVGGELGCLAARSPSPPFECGATHRGELQHLHGLVAAVRSKPRRGRCGANQQLRISSGDRRVQRQVDRATAGFGLAAPDQQLGEHQLRLAT